MERWVAERLDHYIKVLLEASNDADIARGKSTEAWIKAEYRRERALKDLVAWLAMHRHELRAAIGLL